MFRRPISIRFLRSQTGFSLIELLVSISIIALLLGILLPALSHARIAAMKSGCASGIRQIAIANTAYSHDARGRFAPGASDFLSNLDRWHGHRDDLYTAFVPEGGPLSPYLGTDGKVRQCAAFDTEDRENDPFAFERGSGGYGYNNMYLGVDRDGSDVAGVYISDIRSPLLTVMFADAAFLLPYPDDHLVEYSFAEPPEQRDSNGRGQEGEMDPSVHFRHAIIANVAWADTHVSSEVRTFTRGNVFGGSSESMAMFEIGWFGDETNAVWDLE